MKTVAIISKNPELQSLVKSFQEYEKSHVATKKTYHSKMIAALVESEALPKGSDIGNVIIEIDVERDSVQALTKEEAMESPSKMLDTLLKVLKN